MGARSILTFENMYDAHSSIVYGIAFHISPNQHVAEQILVNTFRKAYKQMLTEQKLPSLCMTLIRLTIETAHEELNPGKTSNFKLNVFETDPLLQQLICGQLSFEDYCSQNKLTNAGGAKKIRLELNFTGTSARRNNLQVQPQVSQSVY